jgi:hypothetical protein
MKKLNSSTIKFYSEGSKVSSQDMKGFKKRWMLYPSNDFLKKNFTQLPNAFIRDPNLSAGAKVLMANLISRVGIYEKTWVGVETLSKETGVGERTLIRKKRELKNLGLIEEKRKGQGRTNHTRPADLFIHYHQRQIEEMERAERNKKQNNR